MGQLIEFELEQGGSVLVEVPDVVGISEPVLRGRIGSDAVVERARQTFDEAVSQIQPAAQAIVERLCDFALSPSEIRVQFGLNLHAEAGAFIAAAGTSAAFTIDLKWEQGDHG